MVALTLAFVHFRETSSEMRAIITTVLPPTGYALNFGTNQAFALPAISPDGKRIVFGAVSKDGKSQLWLRSLDSATAHPLTGSEGAVSPFWSPDSRYVGFGSADSSYAESCDSNSLAGI